MMKKKPRAMKKRLMMSCKPANLLTRYMIRLVKRDKIFTTFFWSHDILALKYNTVLLPKLTPSLLCVHSVY